MKHPIELMGPTTYTRTVQLLQQIDRLLTDLRADHAQAVEAGDSEMAATYSRGIDWLIQSIAEWGEILRAMSSRNNSNPTT